MRLLRRFRRVLHRRMDRGKAPTASPRAFEVERLEPRLLLSAAMESARWVITGDADAANLNDAIVVRRSSEQPSMLEAMLNGEVIDTRAESTVRSIEVRAGAGDDTVRMEFAETAGRIAVTIHGGDGNDVLIGGAERDRMYGGAGDDEIGGGAGRDFLHGGAGNDTINGGADRDVLYGNRGDDELHGDGGRDWFFGGLGINNVFGSRWTDTVRLRRQDSFHETAEANNLASTPIDDFLKQQLIEAAVRQYQSLFGQHPYWWDWYDQRGIAAPVAYTTALDSAAIGVATDHSTTNTQVGGVDEADLVETDGQSLFVLRNNELVIVNAGLDDLSVLSATAIEGYADGIYLAGDRLIVVSSIWASMWLDPIVALDGLVRPMVLDGRPGMSNTPQVKISVFDVSDPANPIAVEENYVDGSLIDSRMIGDQMYLVLQSELGIPRPMLVDAPAEENPAEGRAGTGDELIALASRSWGWLGGDRGVVYESEAAYRARLEAMSIDQWLPQWRATFEGQAEGDALGGGLVEDLYLPAQLDGEQLMSVVLFNFADGAAGVDDAATTFGVWGQVYASMDSLYIASTSWEWNWDDVEALGPTTSIYQFALGVDDVSLQATGAAPGSVLNQFSMDEHDGRFRIAVNQGWGATQSNALYVFERDGSELTIAGSLTGLATGERIYAARFIGDTAYVVTFRQVDPLFVIDLSNPALPTVLGELKIPGYSSYLQPAGEGYLLGIGRDADLDGRVKGLQVSLFDVNDPANPARLDQAAIESANYSWSEAEWDHHALAYFEDAGILVLPFDDWSWSGGMQHSLVVYAVNPDTGIEETGRIEHDQPIRRSLRIGNRLYSMSMNMIKVHDLFDPSTLLAELSLADGAV